MGSSFANKITAPHPGPLLVWRGEGEEMSRRRPFLRHVHNSNFMAFQPLLSRFWHEIAGWEYQLLFYRTIYRRCHSKSNDENRTSLVVVQDAIPCLPDEKTEPRGRNVNRQIRTANPALETSRFDNVRRLN